ncbi:MAG: hypothetical protein F4X65_00280 [Chloroflexi bacterium]|nr:hypothetical protein [Chloroflexota bacterium]
MTSSSRTINRSGALVAKAFAVVLLAVMVLAAVGCATSTDVDRPAESGERHQELAPNSTELPSPTVGHLNSDKAYGAPEGPAPLENISQEASSNPTTEVSTQQQASPTPDASTQAVPVEVQHLAQLSAGEESMPRLDQAGTSLAEDSAQPTPETLAAGPGVASSPGRVPMDESGSGELPTGVMTDELGPSQQLEGNTADVQVLNLPAKKRQKYPNLSPNLYQLVVDLEDERTNAESAPAGASPDGPNGQDGHEPVAVTIYLSGHVDEVVAFLEDNGGDPRNVGEDYIEAYLPVVLLGPVSERPGVTRVTEIIPPRYGSVPPVSIP